MWLFRRMTVNRPAAKGATLYVRVSTADRDQIK